jgi:hypothetical protein
MVTCQSTRAPARKSRSSLARTVPGGTEVRVHLTSENGPVPAIGIVVKGTRAPARSL